MTALTWLIGICSRNAGVNHSGFGAGALNRRVRAAGAPVISTVAGTSAAALGTAHPSAPAAMETASRT